MRNINMIIEECLKVEFDRFIGEIMDNEDCTWNEAVENLEFDNYEKLVDKTLCYCKYLDFQMIVEFWDNFIEDCDDDAMYDILEEELNSSCN